MNMPTMLPMPNGPHLTPCAFVPASECRIQGKPLAPSSSTIPMNVARSTIAVLVALCAVPLACSSGSGSAGSSTATSASAAVTIAPAAVSASASALATAGPIAPDLVIGVPYPPQEIGKVVNPKGEPKYSGPTGTLRGTVKITGDASPTLEVRMPTGACRGEAVATHGKLFRTGQNGTLADALVAVTGYRGYVPPSSEVAKLTIHSCSYARRTLVATYGQRVEVSNLDKLESYMPFLDGAPSKAMIVAVPGGDPVRMYPHQPGHYLLRDNLPNPHLTADVFVLAYSTHDVTGLDGKYEIKGIPVGPVNVNAMLPSTGKSVGERVEIKEGDNTLDLTLTFDAAKDKPKKGTSGDVTASIPPPAPSTIP